MFGRQQKLTNIFDQTLRYLLFDNKTIKESPESLGEATEPVAGTEGRLSNEHVSHEEENAILPIRRHLETYGSSVKMVNETQDSGSEEDKCPDLINWSLLR